MSKIDPHSLQGILLRIKKPDRRDRSMPELFKNNVLSALQLYFDGLVESRDLRPEVIEERHNVLNAMIKATRLTVPGYYRKEKEIQYRRVQERIMPLESAILKYGSKNRAKHRHLFGCEYSISEYGKMVERDFSDKGVQLVIPIASGGFEPGMLVAECLNVKNILPVRYSHIHRRDPYVRMTEKISIPSVVR